MKTNTVVFKNMRRTVDTKDLIIAHEELVRIKMESFSELNKLGAKMQLCVLGYDPIDILSIN